MTLGDLLLASARNVPQKTALVMAGRALTFASWNERANRVANALLGLGLGAGDRVSIYLSNCLEWAEAYFGVTKSGGIVAPVNAWFREKELGVVLRHAEPRFVITERALLGYVRKVRENVASIAQAVIVDEPRAAPLTRGELDYRGLLEAASAAEPGVPLSEQDVQAIVYTSGTTGAPKGTVLTHLNQLLAGFYILMHEWGLRHEDVFLAAAPFCFRTGLHRLHLCAGLGGTTHYLERFEARQMLKVAAEERVTALGVVPTMLHKLLDVLESEPYDLQALRVVFSTSAPLPQADKERLLTLFPHVELNEYYAATEGGIISNLKPCDQLRKLNCVGKPALGMQVRLLDDMGRDAPQGETGEIAVSSGPGGGPLVFREYFRNPQATAAAMRGDWYLSGDLGRFDEDGYLYVMGRKKDMIISGGVNIFPRDIEEHLCTHPSVREAAVVGVPDAQWGEIVTAVVALQSGVQVGEEDLIAYCKDALASYKKPRRVLFCEELPKNANGKIMKDELRQSIVGAARAERRGG
ncbi:MAG: AMP-binding protein [Candidatus Tectomicrobia bacterium]|nr:AMP-binding protein [Candidatus Tectomicrobia bacterium]